MPRMQIAREMLDEFSGSRLPQDISLGARVRSILGAGGLPAVFIGPNDHHRRCGEAGGFPGRNQKQHRRGHRGNFTVERHGCGELHGLRRMERYPVDQRQRNDRSTNSDD